jgi:pimeloyl-ACP methyl ester carboxylesterase
VLDPRPDPANAVEVAGPVDAPAIVLVHGSVVSRKMWLPQLRGWSGEYRVVAPDLPGHGDLAAARFTLSAAVETVAGAIARHTGGRALVVGLSLGGWVAIEHAHRHPETISGLVLVGCSRNLTGGLGFYLRAVSGLMRRGMLRQSTERTAEKTRRLFPASLHDVAEEQMRAGVHSEPLADAFAETAGKKWTELLASVDVPILLVNGERDSMARGGESDFLAALPRARAITIAGAGHACNLDRPEEFDRAVLEFARSTLATPGGVAG